jgi:preprotein translocase subunit SecG
MMDIVFKLVLAAHILVCFALIVVVLLQSSKGGGLAGAFGGGGGQTIFGGQETATFLSKATTYLAVMFMLLSLSLAYLSSQKGPQEGKIRRSRVPAVARDVIPRGGSVEEVLGAAASDTTQTEKK